MQLFAGQKHRFVTGKGVEVSGQNGRISPKIRLEPFQNQRNAVFSGFRANMVQMGIGEQKLSSIPAFSEQAVGSDTRTGASP